MTSVLAELMASAKHAADQREQRRAEVERRLAWAPSPRDPLPAFRSPGLSVIAEVKRSSPSKGALAEILDPAELARDYERGGAAAVSVLTEPTRFGGSLEDLAVVRDAVDLPVLRKDFISTDFQLLEARALGADLALLIVAGLDQATLTRLYATASGLGLTPLVEVHSVEEGRRAADVGAQLIGVNNRDLTTLEVDVARFEKIAPTLPGDAVLVAESGLLTDGDVRRVRSAGADVVLMGEALVTSGDPGQAVSRIARLDA